VVAGIRGGEVGETAAGPVEVAAVHDRAADGGAVAAQELGGAMCDDVRAPLEGAAQVWGGEGIVDHDRDGVFLAQRGDLLEGKNGDVGIAQRLAVQDLRVGPDRLLKPARIGRVDKRDVNADARECVRELVVGAAVEPA